MKNITIEKINKYITYTCNDNDSDTASTELRLNSTISQSFHFLYTYSLTERSSRDFSLQSRDRN